MNWAGVKHDAADRLSIHVENLKVVFELAAAKVGRSEGERSGHVPTVFPKTKKADP